VWVLTQDIAEFEDKPQGFAEHTRLGPQVE
jgi:hypothetical protein